MTITATFEVGTDVDKAVFNVNNRVQLALPRLPDEVRRNGVIVAEALDRHPARGRADLARRPRYDTLFLSNYAHAQRPRRAEARARASPT